MGYHTIGRLAMGNSALGFSSGFAVKVVNDDPGPHRIKACRPGCAIDTAWGILKMASRSWMCQYSNGEMLIDEIGLCDDHQNAFTIFENIDSSIGCTFHLQFRIKLRDPESLCSKPYYEPERKNHVRKRGDFARG